MQPSQNPSPRPKAKKLNPEALRIAKTEAFKEIVRFLEKEHPLLQFLSPVASLEQRALHQCRCQEYETILQSLRQLSTNETLKSIPSTYGATEPKK